MKKLIQEFDLMLAGSQYNDANGNNRFDNAEGSRTGSVFDLEIEHDNPVDPLAVICRFIGKDIGYVPKDENLEIAYYLTHPEFFEIECRQKKKIDNDRTYETIVVIIKIYAVSKNYIPFSYDVFDAEFPDYDNEVLERNKKLLQKPKEEIQIKKAIPIKENDSMIKSALIAVLIMLLLFFSFMLLKAFFRN